MNHYTSMCECGDVQHWTAQTNTRTHCPKCNGTNLKIECQRVGADDKLTRALAPTVVVPAIRKGTLSDPPLGRRTKRPRGASFPPAPPLPAPGNVPSVMADPLELLLTTLTVKTQTAEVQRVWAERFGTSEEFAAAKASQEAYQDTLKMLQDVLRPRR